MPWFANKHKMMNMTTAWYPTFVFLKFSFFLYHIASILSKVFNKYHLKRESEKHRSTYHALYHAKREYRICFHRLITGTKGNMVVTFIINLKS